MALYTKQPCDIDTRLLKINPTGNTGAGAYIVLGWAEPATNIQRSILQFDISDLPNGVTINTAKLYLYYFEWESSNPVGKTAWAYKLTRTDWEEMEATWNIYKTGSNWTAAGGDYVTSDPSGGSDVFPAAYGWMEWDVKAIVEDAILNVGDLVELLVKFANETAAGSGYGNFHSSEYTDDTDLCPKLVIEYTPVVAKPYGLVV